MKLKTWIFIFIGLVLTFNKAHAEIIVQEDGQVIDQEVIDPRAVIDDCLKVISEHEELRDMFKAKEAEQQGIIDDLFAKVDSYTVILQNSKGKKGIAVSPIQEEPIIP